MIKVWAGRDWLEEYNDYGDFNAEKIKGDETEWFRTSWPPVRMVVMTEEEYKTLIKEEKP